MDMSNIQQFSHQESMGSVTSITASSTSSNQNSDDEDESFQLTAHNYRDRRRELHTQAEQKRRDAIKRGYDELYHLVHPVSNNVDMQANAKLSKATILQKSVTQIERLTVKKKQKDAQLDKLRREVVALKIMKDNYEHIVKTNQSASTVGSGQIPDDVKFHVFQCFMNDLFETFNRSTSVTSFTEASSCIINWLEEHCKPQRLNQLMESVLDQVLSQYSTNNDLLQNRLKIDITDNLSRNTASSDFH